MVENSSLSNLLGALSEAIAQSIDIDEREECVLEFEGAVEVVLAQARDGHVLSFRSPVTPAGQPLEIARLHQALAFNYTRMHTSMPLGCAIALDEASSQLLLVGMVDADRTPAEDFLSVLSQVIELVPPLRESFDAPRPPSDGMQIAGVMA